MRAEGGSPNLINGVSRQPSEVRLPSQLEESINQFPTVTRGLVPRNPAKLRGVITGSNPENSTVHLIDRDDTEQYVVTVSPNGVEVADLAGNKKTVTAPNGWGYLAGADEGDLEALTVADHTFIVNKKRVVTTTADLTPNFGQAGLVHIVTGDYHNDYSVLINGGVYGRYTTDGGPYSDEGSARSAERGVRPAVIANQLLYGSPPSGISTLPANASISLAGSLPGADWEFARYDNVIFIRNRHGNAFSLDVQAGAATRARAHKDVTQEFSELPRKAPNGFAIRVSGSDATNYDDYYVRFDHPAGAAEGRWKETVAPSIQYRIEPTTMPHILVRNPDGTFTFKVAEWANREVGDLETNPWPSFVGHTIEGMVFFKNRIGFTSGESVAMSRHGEFFNFFVESILTPLDTDPVDISISYPEISDINFAVPYAGEMVMFTRSVPFRLAGGELFTPSSASFEHLLSNRVSSKVKPVTAGSRLYFVNDAESGCFVHEFMYDREVGIKDAPSISDHVNGYIPSGVRMMQVEEDLNILLLQSEREPNALYVYKWLWIGNEKAQSAWQKWTVADPIIGMKFFGEELVLVTNRTGSREILSINCHEAWTDGKATPIYLDRRVDVLGYYDAASDTTSFTLPYPAQGAQIVFKDGDEFGFQPDGLTYSDNTVIAPGNHAKVAYVGFDYESYGDLSPMLQRGQNSQGGYGNAIPGVTTTVNNVTFETEATAYLTVEVERAYRKPHKYDFSAALVGTKTGTFGSLVVGEIKKPVSVMGEATDTNVRFGKRGPYPYAIMGYRWTGASKPISF